VTTLTWSNEQILKEFAGCGTLKEIISSVESKMWKKGEVVCEIFVNGFALQEDDEVKFSESALADIKELRVQLNRPEELVQQTLQSIAIYIPELAAETDHLASCYRDVYGPGLESQEEVDREVQKLLSEVLEGFRWLTDAIYLIRVQLENWPQVEELLLEWKDLEDKHSKSFKELITAFEQQDQVLIADVLEYDVADVLEDWRRIIPQVLSGLKGDNISPACSSES
jgi:hypothetical protein